MGQVRKVSRCCDLPHLPHLPYLPYLPHLLSQLLTPNTPTAVGKTCDRDRTLDTARSKQSG
jgi:hypothetical protein